MFSYIEEWDDYIWAGKLIIDEIECPCGQGKIICENKSDGWNRYDENVYLQCETCKKDII